MQSALNCDQQDSSEKPDVDSSNNNSENHHMLPTRSHLRVALATLAALGMTMLASPLHAQPKWQWVKAIKGPTFDECLGVGLGPDGNLHMVGIFNDSVTVDSSVLVGIGNYDGYTARFNDKGKLLDADAYGGFYVDETKSIAVDNKGNYYVAGAFEDQALIAVHQIESLEPFDIDMFVAKFDKAGIFQWVSVFGATDYQEAAPFVAVDSLGAVYVAGGFANTCRFGTKRATSNGASDIFVCKMSAGGDVTWVKTAGGAGHDQAYDVDVSPNGDRVYVVGVFSGSVDFGSGIPTQSYAGSQDMFAWALNANGSLEWVKQIGQGTKDDNIHCFTDVSGGLLTTGTMIGTTKFDDKTLTAVGGIFSDAFVCRFTKSGSIDLLKAYGGPYADVGMAVYSDSRNAIYLTGSFDTTSVFGSTAVNSYGGLDIFFLRLFQNGDVEWAISAGGEFNDVGTGIAVSPTGIPYLVGTFDTRAWFGGELLQGEKFDDAFIGALECGPNTAIVPKHDTITICEGQDSLVRAPNNYPSYKWFVDGVARPNSSRAFFNLKVLPQGTHQLYVRIQDIYGCFGQSDPFVVVVTPGLPEPLITKVGNILGCSVADVMYQWYREGRAIAGATSQTVEISGNGLYRVLISDGKGCERWSDNFLVGSTDVQELAGHGISVYPNPFSQDVMVRGALGAELVVVDLLGNEVFRAIAGQDTHTMQIPGAAGSYVLLIKQQGHVYSVVLLKK
jgi:hypothetical protein